MTTREDWQRRLGPLYGGAVALVSSTPWRWPTEVGDDTRSSGWIVALGVPIGLVAWLVATALAKIGVATPIAALVGLAALTLASAALVERGIADRVDRLVGQPQGQARSPGVPAVLALVFTTLIRAAAIVMVPPAHWLAVLVMTAVVGRWAAVFLQGLGDPIVDQDVRRSLVATPTPAWLTAALSLAVAALTVFALGKVGIVALVVTAIAAFALGLDAQRREGRLSAPVVSVAAAIGELAVLIVATSS
ncbi:MAG: hypothetical protein JWP01_3164 [Myxococcales bacterium]|nr:hypothetical protein [Myxococcales bacterium]